MYCLKVCFAIAIDPIYFKLLGVQFNTSVYKKFEKTCLFPPSTDNMGPRMQPIYVEVPQ